MRHPKLPRLLLLAGAIALTGCTESSSDDAPKPDYRLAILHINDHHSNLDESDASLRLRLDISQMPKTFQVSALSSRDWNLVSDWQHWSFPPGNPKAADAEADSGTSREGGHLPGLKVAPALVTPPLSPAAVESAP